MTARELSVNAEEAPVRVGAVLGNATGDGWPGRVTYEFVPGAEAIPQLAPREARRLFGAAAGHRHRSAPGLPGGAPP